MIKKIIYTLIIAVGVYYGYTQYAKYIKDVETYKRMLSFQSKTINKMKQTIILNDSIFMVKADEIKFLKNKDNNEREKLKSLANKLGMLEQTFIKIKAQRDSLMNLNFVINKDTIVNNKYNFISTFDLFSISGSYGCSPRFINATLKQDRPLILNIGIYRSGNKYSALIHSNSKLLQFDKAYISFKQKQKDFFDKTELLLGVPINHFGFTGGLFYNNYGIQYTKFVDDYNIVVEYKSTLRNMWEMIR